MAFYDSTWYCNAGDQSTTGYYAVTKRPQNAAVAAGALRRQFTAPAVGSERCFVCIVAGTTQNVADATWVLTRGAKTTDGTVTWQECTGASAVNGDATNTSTWTQAKATGTPTLGAIIKRDNGASYWICSTAGTMGASEPAWANNTAGTTQADGTTTWTCLGVVGNFTGGQAPFARFASVFGTNWFAAGNTVYVASIHAESQATIITFTTAGNNTTIGKALCHSSAGSYPPVAADLTTGATISTTGAVNFQISANGAFYFYGITFKSAVGQSSSQSLTVQGGGTWLYFDRCSFEIATTNSAAFLSFGGTVGGTMVFNNTTVKFANVGQSIVIIGQFVWQNTGTILVSGSSVPTSLLNNATNSFTDILLEALDLSQLTGNILVAPGASQQGKLLVKDCKLHASTVAVSTTPGLGSTVQLVRCDSAGTAYKSARTQYEGTETTETSITRVGGAADPSAQAQSRKIVTTANALWLRPFQAESYAAWNATAGSNVTATVRGVISTGVLPNNDDIWAEFEYLGASGSPLGSIVNTSKTNFLSTAAAVSSDSSTWNGVATSFDGVAVLVGLSNGNLTATMNVNTANQGVVSTAFRLGGKYYFEVLVQVTTTTGNYAGAAASDFNGVYGTASAISGTVISISTASSSVIFSNGATTGLSLGTTAVGDVFCFALDITARLAWVRRNNGNWNASGAADPATGVGGVAMTPALSFAPVVRFIGIATSTDAMTANFGASAYAFTPPSGFSNWSDGWTSFKLEKVLSSPQPGLAGYIEARVRVGKASATYYIDPMVTLT